MLNNRNIETIKLNKPLDYKNLELFKIIEAHENSIYELKLSTSIKKLYFVFHL